MLKPAGEEYWEPSRGVPVLKASPLLLAIPPQHQPLCQQVEGIGHLQQSSSEPCHILWEAMSMGKTRRERDDGIKLTHGQGVLCRAGSCICVL